MVMYYVVCIWFQVDIHTSSNIPRMHFTSMYIPIGTLLWVTELIPDSYQYGHILHFIYDQISYD